MSDREARAMRHACQSELRVFLPFAFRWLYPRNEYIHNWSIDVLGDALQRCLTGETKRLIINMPPRSLKSFCCSVALPAWLLGRAGESNFACIAGHRGLAQEQHELAHRLMLCPRFRGLFPHAVVHEAGCRLKVPQGGARVSLTPSGALTGSGADFIIIDDPQSPQDADTPRRSESIRNWYDRNIYQRLDDKHDGVVILVMQRLSHDDLTAHLLAQGGWEHLRIPAIAMEDERLPASLGGQVVRLAGDAMNPERECRDQLREAMLRMGAMTFMSQYQQRPYPPGEGINRSGCFLKAPPPDGPEHERRMPRPFLGCIPEENFVLDEVFCEPMNLWKGPVPEMTIEEWAEWGNSMPHAGNSSDESRQDDQAERVRPDERPPPAKPDRDNRFRVWCEPCTEDDIRRQNRPRTRRW
ncbi:MAG: hypothetical protein AAGB48_09720 [Planctomycetota bacterium]